MTRFETGAKVRVKSGVSAPDFEDIPLGGWTGTIKASVQSHHEISYEIEWDRRTLDAMHPVYRTRCEQDELDLEFMWLQDEDLEPDAGPLVPVEQPTEIRTPPLLERDQDDRVRKAFGLTHDDLIPEISTETLRAYHGYLTARMKFPFTVRCGIEELGPFSRKRATMAVTALVEPDRENIDLEEGLICTCRARDVEIELPLASIDVGKKNPNFKLIADYAYWFHNWSRADEDDFDWDDDGQVIEPSELSLPSFWICLYAAFVWGVRGGFQGATIGAAVRTLSGAGQAAMIGGISLGTTGAILLGLYGFITGARTLAFLGVSIGSVGGGLVGVVAGLAVVAFPWSLLGLIAGIFLRPYLFSKSMSGAVQAFSFGICGGILIAAFRHDRAQATGGTVSGAIIGSVIAGGAVLLLCLVTSLVIGRLKPDGKVGVGFETAEEEENDDEEGDDEDKEQGGGLRLRHS